MLNVTVYKEIGLPFSGITQSFSLPKNFNLIYQNTQSIISEGVLGDFFFNAHGGVFLTEIEGKLTEFFEGGGGLIHMGGAPFCRAMTIKDGAFVDADMTYRPVKKEVGFGSDTIYFDLFAASLGLNPYSTVYPEEQTEVRFCDDMIDLPSMKMKVKNGVTVSKCLPMHRSNPDFFMTGALAYMARPICRQTNIAASCYTPDGECTANVLLFVKNYANVFSSDPTPAKPWVIFTPELEENLPQTLWDKICNFLGQECFLKEPELPLSTLHEGEEGSIYCDLSDKLPKGWQIRCLKAFESAEDVKLKKEPSWTEDSFTKDGNRVCATQKYSGEKLLSAIRFELRDQDFILRDFAQTALVNFNPELLKDCDRLSANGSYFDITSKQGDEKSVWISGTNWQDRDYFAFSFYNPNPLRIAGDMADIAATGMKIVRCHYFMPAWFHDACMHVYGNTHGDFFKSFDRDAVELDERFMRALEAHSAITACLGLFFMPTVFTDVGENMGNSATWMSQTRLYDNDETLERQLRFSRQVMERLSLIPSLTVDLCNEPDTATSLMSRWLNHHSPIWSTGGHMVGVGTFKRHNNLDLGEYADWHSYHLPCCKIDNIFRTGKPGLLQEAWVPTPSTDDGENNIEKYLNKAISSTLVYGGAGFMPWNWNMNNMNWRYGGHFVDYWDMELGCSTHADETPRRGLPVQRNWALLLKGVSFAQENRRQVAYIYPKLTTSGNPDKIECFMALLDRLNVAFCALNDRDVKDADLSETKLIILPYFARGFRKETYERLRKFAKGGGAVIAFRSIAVCDENGVTDPLRDIPDEAGYERIGKGFFYWFTGLNIEEKYEKKVTERIINELDLPRYDRLDFKLLDGRIKFTECWSDNEYTMPTDWCPDDKLPDKYIPDSVRITDDDGNLKKAWVQGGTVTDGDVSFTSKASMFIHKTENGYMFTGSKITIFSPYEYKWKIVTFDNNGVRVVDDKDICVIKSGNCYTFSLKGYQQYNYIRISKQN